MKRKKNSLQKPVVTNNAAAMPVHSPPPNLPCATLPDVVDNSLLFSFIYQISITYFPSFHIKMLVM